MGSRRVKSARLELSGDARRGGPVRGYLCEVSGASGLVKSSADPQNGFTTTSTTIAVIASAGTSFSARSVLFDSVGLPAASFFE